jgi:hypothetical protein
VLAESFLDRRRQPRRAASGLVQSGRAVAVSVRILDIGLSGVLVASSQAFEVGQCARLTARLGDRAIDTDVEVRRVSAPGDDRNGYRIGARFVSPDETTRQAMQQFLTQRSR